MYPRAIDFDSVDQNISVVVEPSDRGQLISGGLGNNDLVQIVVSLSEAMDPLVEADFDAYQAHLDSGLFSTPFYLPSLDISLVDFENFDRLFEYGSYRGVYQNPVVGTNASETLIGTDEADLIIGLSGNDTLIGDMQIGGGGGNDIFIGGPGNDSFDGGPGDDTILFMGTNNGYDTILGGAGFDRMVATSSGTIMGIDGIGNSVEQIEGPGDAVIRDTNAASVLDFSATELMGILEIDAASGNDTIVASNLSSSVYRGGPGNDTLQGSAMATTWLFSGTNNGFDTFLRGSGAATAIAESAGTVIGVNGFDRGADAFQGLGDTEIRDTNAASTLDFSSTVLMGIAVIDAASGNDTIVTSNLSEAIYRGGPGNDNFVLSAPATGQLALSATIADFASGNDKIDLRALGLAFADIVGVDDGVGTVLTLGGDLRSLRLRDTLFADLDANDFLF